MLMKLFFTAIILITFQYAFAQNDTSGIRKSLGNSVLFTDFKPVYTTKIKFYNLTIDKIEYTKEEMILFFRFVNCNKWRINFPIFGKKNKEAWCLKSEEKIFNILNVKNIRVNGKLYSMGIPNDLLTCLVKEGEVFTCEIYFPRLPKEIKTVSLIQGIENDDNYSFNCYDLKIKSTGDSIDEINEKYLLNKMELNKPLTLNNIYFETGKSELLDSSYSELNMLFNILDSKPKMIIQISGYTDNIGKVQDNLVLSEARANAVKKYLTDAGIDKNRIVAKGYGSTNPKASNDTKEGRAQNRRVEITVLKNE
jgi:outer membrane protein OmpA-like peptidoglycan-associated protein